MLKNKKGFTLIELLIVIGIVAILAAAVIIAINPGHQFASARDVTRQSHLGSIDKAFLSYQVDNNGNLPDYIPLEPIEICNIVEFQDCEELIDLSDIIPDYLSFLPLDPKGGIHAKGTGYFIHKDELGRVGITAENAETRIIAIGIMGGTEMPPAQQLVDATGGNMTTDGDYRIHTFTDIGSHTFEVIAGGEIEVLVVAGGGGGGTWGGGGGGGGGVIYNESYIISPGNINVIVGDGGQKARPSPINQHPTNGENSIFSSIIAIGGGRGAATNYNSPPGVASCMIGGSGGGGNYGAGTSGCSGNEGQGNAGGNSISGSPFNGGGGGGAGSSGTNANSGAAGNGGDGLSFNISGSTIYYGGGGGAGSQSSGQSSLGGSGGGGRGGDPSNNTGNGQDYTGGGGGGGGVGGSASQAEGGNGGSGIVIVRYQYQ